MIVDAKGKADILQEQYVSVFSNPDDCDIESALSSVNVTHDETLEDFDFDESDIINAIKELDPYAGGPDDTILGFATYKL